MMVPPEGLAMFRDLCMTCCVGSEKVRDPMSWYTVSRNALRELFVVIRQLVCKWCKSLDIKSTGPQLPPDTIFLLVSKASGYFTASSK